MRLLRRILMLFLDILKFALKKVEKVLVFPMLNRNMEFLGILEMQTRVL